MPDHREASPRAADLLRIELAGERARVLEQPVPTRRRCARPQRTAQSEIPPHLHQVIADAPHGTGLAQLEDAGGAAAQRERAADGQGAGAAARRQRAAAGDIHTAIDAAHAAERAAINLHIAADGTVHRQRACVDVDRPAVREAVPGKYQRARAGLGQRTRSAEDAAQGQRRPRARIEAATGRTGSDGPRRAEGGRALQAAAVQRQRAARRAQIDVGRHGEDAALDRGAAGIAVAARKREHAGPGLDQRPPGNNAGQPERG
ncbi:hypothetical protein D3C71_1461290 [compost metagenome]